MHGIIVEVDVRSAKGREDTAGRGHSQAEAKSQEPAVLARVRREGGSPARPATASQLVGGAVHCNSPQTIQKEYAAQRGAITQGFVMLVEAGWGI